MRFHDGAAPAANAPAERHACGLPRRHHGLRQKPAPRLEPGPDHGEQRSGIEHEVGHRINSSLFFLLVVLPTASFS